MRNSKIKKKSYKSLKFFVQNYNKEKNVSENI